MAHELTFRAATLRQFSDLFQDKKEYRAAIGEMSVKERILNWKATTDFETAFRSNIVENALVKRGSGALKVTSYRISEKPGECTAYVSYGGKGLRLIEEGREYDVGFFLTATEESGGLKVRVLSKREHYKMRTRINNTIFVIVGLVLGIIPGIVILGLILFLEPGQVKKRIERFIRPPLSQMLNTEIPASSR